MSSVFTEELFSKFEVAKKELLDKISFKAFVENFKREEYSMNNKIMVCMQNPQATETRGFQAWKKLNRTVKKGEKAIYIFAVNETEKEDEKTGEKKIRKYFGIRPVFDIAQTEVITPTE